MASPPAQRRREPPRSRKARKSLLIVVLIISGALYGLAIVYSAGPDERVAMSVVAMFSFSMLAISLQAAVSTSGVSTRHRGVAVAVACLLLGSSFGATSNAVLPGAPLAHARVTTVGAQIALPPGLGGRRVLVRVRGTVADGPSDVVHFALSTGTTNVEGNLSRVKRGMQIAGRHVHLIDADAEFAEALVLPAGARTLDVTRIDGLVEGGLVVDLLRPAGNRLVPTALLIIAVLLASAIEARLGMRSYAAAISAATAAAALVAVRVTVGSRIESVISAVAFGAGGGLLVGLFTALATRRVMAPPMGGTHPARPARMSGVLRAFKNEVCGRGPRLVANRQRAVATVKAPCYWWVVRQLLKTLTLVCLLGEVSGIFACLMPDRCVEACRDDAPDGTCPPLCQDCGCCSHVSPTLVPGPSETVSTSPIVSFGVHVTETFVRDVGPQRGRAGRDPERLAGRGGGRHERRVQSEGRRHEEHLWRGGVTE